MKVKLTSADVNFGEMIYCLYGKCEIRKGLLKSDNSIEICIKKVSLLSADEKVRKSLEFETMSRLNHENIINLISASIEESNLYIFLEYFPEGDLSRLILSHINQNSPFNEQELFNFAYQLIDALSYMQENSISHRDLKPQNIFVCENSSKLKIGDFGCSRNAIAQTLTLAGTDIWLSPALRLCLSESFITGQRFTHHDPYKSDVYSLGLIFLYMASLIPIDNLAKIENLQYLINTRLDSLQIKYQDFTNLLRNMLKVDEPSREDFIALKSFLIYNYPKCPGCNIVFCINKFFRVGEDILCNECVTTFDPIPFKDLLCKGCDDIFNASLECECSSRCPWCKDFEHGEVSCYENLNMRGSRGEYDVAIECECPRWGIFDIESCSFKCENCGNICIGCGKKIGDINHNVCVFMLKYYYCLKDYLARKN